jgi:sortase A
MSRLPGLDQWRGVLALCLVLLGCQQGLTAAGIEARAWLAPLLIERAWQRSLAVGGRALKPWPWADTWPVARLSVPGAGIDLLVLAGDSGNALAFGPGLAPYSTHPAEAGLTVLAGHRDTHFAFLQHTRAGDVLLLETADGGKYRYEVRSARVVDSTRESIVTTGQPASLLLVTCYPFDTLRVGGPLRYTVRAVHRPV